jgi:hypothetical protein
VQITTLYLREHYAWVRLKCMVKKTVQETKKETKFEPTKMALAVAAAASTVLVLFAVIAIYL